VTHRQQIVFKFPSKGRRQKMKKILLISLATVFLFSLIITSAEALTLDFPITEFKFAGDTALWSNVNGDTYYAPNGGTFVGPLGGSPPSPYPFTMPAPGDTIFSIGHLTDTQAIGGANTTPITQPEELTYIVWGNLLQTITAPDILGNQSFAFVGDPALLPQALADGYPAGLPAPAYIAVFIDTNGAVDFDTAEALGPAGVVGINDFPGITDLLHSGATPWITGYFIPATVGSLPGVTLSGTINFAGAGGPPPTGSEGAEVSLATIPDFNGGGTWTGTANNMFVTGYFGIDPATGLPIDATLANTIQRPFDVSPGFALTSGWFNNDNDPVRAAPIPEPSTVLLLGSAGIVIACLSRKRKMK
jgi:hypothetical protein